MPGSTPSAAAAQRSVRRAVAVAGDAFLPAVMLLSVLVVLVPVPAGLVDLFLAANLAISTLALVGALASSMNTSRAFEPEAGCFRCTDP